MVSVGDGDDVGSVVAADGECGDHYTIAQARFGMAKDVPVMEMFNKVGSCRNLVNVVAAPITLRCWCCW